MKAETGFGSHLLSTAVCTSGQFHPICLDQNPGDSTLCKKKKPSTCCKDEIIFISITKHSVSEDVGAVC